jgi:hypothetical protein
LYSNQTSFQFFSLFCLGSGKKTVMLRCRHPHSLPESSYIMSLAFVR